MRAGILLAAALLVISLSPRGGARGVGGAAPRLTSVPAAAEGRDTRSDGRRAGVRELPSPGDTSQAASLAFPRDHGAHAAAAVEWWYYTGHLRDGARREYGFQLTFFRVHELHLAHFAWADSARGSFEYDEKTHLSLPGIASAAAGNLDVVNEDWSAREKEGIHRLSVSGKAGKLELTLRAVKPPVLHGENGVSRKGPGDEEYSRYVSITRLEASGTLSRGKYAERLSGVAWFDHEWGPGVLPAGGSGWDWFALQLDDGTELMLYRMRDKLGGATPFSSGTFVPKSGPPVPILWSDVRLTETGRWKSPRTGAVYPSGWRIAVSSVSLEVALDPLLRDQELVTEESTGVTYWEGACRVRGARQGRPVTGRAYAELTGYAGRDLPGLAERPAGAGASSRQASGLVMEFRAAAAARSVRERRFLAERPSKPGQGTVRSARSE